MRILRNPIPALDGVRALACLMVLLAHAGNAGWFFYIKGTGQFGVMLFFALSGFLMSYHYLPGKISLRYWLGFLVRRFFRVYPAFMLMTFIYWIGHLLHIPLAIFTGFDLNILFAHWLLLEGKEMFWTIPVEIKFYLLFPLLGLGLLVLPSPPRVKLYLLAIIWIALLALRIQGGHLALWPYLSFFIGGMTAGYLRPENTPLFLSRFRYWDYMAGLLLIGLLFCIYSRIGIIDIHLAWQYRFTSPVMVLIVLSVSRATGTVRRLFSSPVLRFAGHISYSLYLVNLLVFQLMELYVPMPAAAGFFVNIPCVFIVAYILYRTVEMPCHNLGKSLSRRITG